MIDSLSEPLWGNPLHAWLIALAIAIVVSAVTLIVKRLVAKHFMRIAKKTRTDMDDMLAWLIGKINFFFLVVIGLWSGSLYLDLSPGASDIINKVLFAAFFVQSALWGNSVIMYLIEKATGLRKYEGAGAKTTLIVLSYIAKLALWSIVLLIILDNAGFDITTLIASLGIGAIAFALAAQSALEELFASLAIAFDKPFVIGDFIIVDSFLGVIEKVGMRSTHIRSLSGELIVFSNTDLLKSRIRNYQRMVERRILFSLGVIYGTPAEQVRAIPQMVKEIIDGDELARFDRAHFKEYGDYSLNFEFVYYVLDANYNVYMDVQQRINFAIYDRFEKEGIEFAFPTQSIHLQQTQSETAEE